MDSGADYAVALLNSVLGDGGSASLQRTNENPGSCRVFLLRGKKLACGQNDSRSRFAAQFDRVCRVTARSLARAVEVDSSRSLGENF
jgi:hypothetical protein